MYGFLNFLRWANLRCSVDQCEIKNLSMFPDELCFQIFLTVPTMVDVETTLCAPWNLTVPSPVSVREAMKAPALCAWM